MINGYEIMVDQLIKRRHELGMSQEQLSFEIGCAKSLIHKWEQYKRVPSGFMLGCWVEALGLQITVTEKDENSSQETEEV
jgi:ribosome-binding protein aMBF1 (putative translation factor)